MKLVFGAIALAIVTPLPSADPLCAEAGGYACCRVCKKGKACGDSCIAATASCNKPKGCACNG